MRRALLWLALLGAAAVRRAAAGRALAQPPEWAAQGPPEWANAKFVPQEVRVVVLREAGRCSCGARLRHRAAPAGAASRCLRLPSHPPSAWLPCHRTLQALVQLEPGADPADALRGVGTQKELVSNHGGAPLVLAKLNHGQTVAGAVAALNGRRGVQFAEANFVYTKVWWTGASQGVLLQRVGRFA